MCFSMITWIRQCPTVYNVIKVPLIYIVHICINVLDMIFHHSCLFIRNRNFAINSTWTLGKRNKTSGTPATVPYFDFRMWCVFQCCLTLSRSSCNTYWKQNQRHSRWNLLPISRSSNVIISLKKSSTMMTSLFCDMTTKILYADYWGLSHIYEILNHQTHH